MSRAANPQAPEVGLLARILGPLHVTGVFWYRFHAWGVRVLPEWAKPTMIALFTVLFWLLLRRIRRAVAANLAVVLGPCGWREKQRRIYRTLHAFAWCLTERYEHLAGNEVFDFEADNEEVLGSLAQSERGFIFVTAHIGNWEIGAGIPPSLLGRRLHLVREPEGDPRAQEFIRELLERRTSGNLITHFAGQDAMGAGVGLAVALREALDRGDLVALQGDRPRAGGQVVTVDLFGNPTALPSGPAALARVADVSLVPAFVLRRGRRCYQTVLGRPVAVPASEDRSSDLRRAVSSIAAALQAIIRDHPHQWFAFRHVWPDAAGSRPPRRAADR